MSNGSLLAGTQTLMRIENGSTLQWGVPQHEPFYAAQEQSFDNEIPD